MAKGDNSSAGGTSGGNVYQGFFRPRSNGMSGMNSQSMPGYGASSGQGAGMNYGSPSMGMNSMMPPFGMMNSNPYQQPMMNGYGSQYGNSMNTANGMGMTTQSAPQSSVGTSSMDPSQQLLQRYIQSRQMM